MKPANLPKLGMGNLKKKNGSALLEMISPWHVQSFTLILIHNVLVSSRDYCGTLGADREPKVSAKKSQFTPT